MSLDLYLRSRVRPTEEEIERVILPLGWKRQDHHSKSGTLSYNWFFREEFRSIRGCWLFVEYDPEEAPKDTQVRFHSYSNAGRSYEDLDAQNAVLRTLRKHFGGSLFNPGEGNGSYLVNDIPKLSPAEKGCGMAYVYYQQNLGRATLLVDDLSDRSIALSEFSDFFLTLDIGILRNNTLIPFLIAALETFLRELFTRYLELRPEIQERIYTARTKLEYSQLKDLLSGEKTLAQLEAEQYTFQNLASANVAYKRYLEIDLMKVLGVRKRWKSRIRNVREVIEEMLELRHKIIHSAYIDISLNREKVEMYVFYLEQAGQLLAERLLNERSFRIDLEQYI